MTQTPLTEKLPASPLSLTVARRMRWSREQARPEQLPPDDDSWLTWLYLAGRGSGKTRSAAEWLAWQAIRQPGTRWAVVAPTFSDARDTCAEGESGIVSILREYGMLKDYNRSIGEIFLTNKSRIKLFSAAEPDRLRGPQHHGGWFDELAAFQSPDAWNQYQFGLRLGKHPQTVVTTTPRPIPLIRQLSQQTGIIVSRGSTFDNIANLAPSAIAELRIRYENTRLGRQELYGEILEDIEGALWRLADIDNHRVTETPPLVRVVVAIDPAVTSNEDSDLTGIVTAGITANGHYWVLSDDSCRATPDAWARRAVEQYRQWKADRIVGETNNGGDMIELLLRQVDPSIAYRKVTATRGKMLRAEPVASLYEQGRVHHVGRFEALEQQMVSWTPETGTSPDRLDALVWAMTELMSGQTAMMGLASLAKFCDKCGLPAPKSATHCPKCAAPLGG